MPAYQLSVLLRCVSGNANFPGIFTLAEQKVAERRQTDKPLGKLIDWKVRRDVNVLRGR